MNALVSARRCALLLSLSLSLSLLAGCASLMPERTSDTGVDASQPVKPAVFHPRIELDGRLSVRYQQDGKETGAQGSFRWFQDGENVDIVLLSPLNQTIARITVNAREAVLEEGGKPARVAPDIESLTASTLGWPLPAAGLRGWLQAFALDGGSARALAVPGQDHAAPVTASGGWQITYAAWTREEGSGEVRPRRIDLERSVSAYGPLAMRIVIDRWQPLDQKP